MCWRKGSTLVLEKQISRKLLEIQNYLILFHTKCSPDKQEKVGLLSSAAEYILHLASYYLKVDLVREDRLHVFLKIPKKDPDSVLFALAIGGNGAITWEKG